LKRKKIPTPSSFKKYEIVLCIELSEETPVSEALKDLKKATSIVKSSPKIKSLSVCKARGSKIIDGKKEAFDLKVP
jgi:hypothetical protein